MPIDRGIIDKQLQALGEGTRWWEQREMRDLPAVLHSDEQILAISRGKIARVRWLRRSWLIVVTDRRLLCMRSSDGASWRQSEISASQIGRVALRVGPFKGRVLVHAGGHTFRLLVLRQDAQKLVSALSKLASPPNEVVSRTAPTILVRRVIDHILALPAAALAPTVTTEQIPQQAAALAMDERVHTLEDEIEELTKQVKFLEQLLRQRQA